MSKKRQIGECTGKEIHIFKNISAFIGNTLLESTLNRCYGDKLPHFIFERDPLPYKSKITGFRVKKGIKPHISRYLVNAG